MTIDAAATQPVFGGFGHQVIRVAGTCHKAHVFRRLIGVISPVAAMVAGSRAVPPRSAHYGAPPTPLDRGQLRPVDGLARLVELRQHTFALWRQLVRHRQGNEKMTGTIIPLLATIIQIYSFVLLWRVILSWVPNVNPRNPIVQFLYQVTEPVLEPARRALPQIGMIDISPIVVFFGLQLLNRILLSIAGGA